MATKKRVTQYQYQPPITPRHWSGDELNYAVRLSQTLDDIYNKYSALRTALKEIEEGGGGGIAVETDPTVPAWAKEENPPSYTKSDVGLGNVANERQYSANNPPPYPVTSVNGQTGAVSIVIPEGGITEEEDPTVPSWAKQPNKPTYSKSDVGLGNVADVLQYSASNPPPYPVTSVNGQTGAVTIAVGGDTGKKTYTVTMNTSFVNSGSITAYSSGGVLVVGGYLETKKQHAISTANTICTISGVQVVGLNYAAVANHNSTSEKTFTSLLLTENGSTRVQLEGAAYALAAYSWINFTVVGILA